MLLRLGRFVAVTEAEGPGRRAAVWVQGCGLACPGCCNPQLVDPRGGREVPIGDLVRQIDVVHAQIEGITLQGGEPFDQAAVLSELAQAARLRGLSVMTFTGYTLAELRNRADPGTRALLDTTDLLVDGPFLASQPDKERRWVGSTNQVFHFLTPRYRPGIERAGAAAPLRVLEVTIAPDGAVRGNGWPDLPGKLP